MTTADSWVLLRTCSDGFEAEMLVQQLEAEAIPVLVKSPKAGIFGAGYQGGVPGGIDLFVPASAVDEARELIAESDEEPLEQDPSD